MNRWAVFFILALVVACALRLPQLDNRPMHNDEAVNAVKFGALWDRGEYKYDPHEYHGPTLHYLTAASCKVSGAPDYQHLSEVHLRLLTALVGVGLLLLLPLVRDALGRGAMIATACATALSPMMVFYGRYWIHETLLVLFSFLALAGGWRFLQKPSWAWAVITGLALGLMHATKETFVLALAAAGGALVLNWAWRRRVGGNAPAMQLPMKFIAGGIVAWVIVWAVFFTSFFANPTGLLDSIRTYGPWLGNAGQESIHAHEWSFYFERLFWFHPSKGPLWSEGLLLILAIGGAASAFRRNFAGDGSPAFIRFLAGYTLLLAAIYSVIPYKTPWCALGFMHGLILLAGVGVAVLWRTCNAIAPRVVLSAILGLGAAHLGWQAWRASFPLCADRVNPWVYSQTSPDLLNLVAKVKAVATAGQGEASLIKVICSEDDYWPLPWYLREFPNTGWWGEVPEDPVAPLVIASATLNLQLDAQKTHVMVGYFALRPQVFLELYVELGLWEQYLARQPVVDSGSE